MSSPSYTVDEFAASLRFCFRSRDNDFRTIVFVLFVATYSTFLGQCAMSMFIAQPPVSQRLGNLSANPFLFGWLLAFLAILLYIIISTWIEIVWRFTGKEIVEISKSSISIRHQILKFGVMKNFRTEKIPCIFISRHKDNESITALLISLKERRLSSFDRGKLAFNYGKDYFGERNTIRFGSILDAEQAKQVIATIHHKFPQYKCPEKGAG